MKLKKVLYLGLASLMVAGVGASISNQSASAHANHVSRKAKVVKRNHVSKTNKNNESNSSQSQDHENDQSNEQSVAANSMRTPISYRKSSETIPYPKHLSARKDRIVVSLKKQRAYLMRGKKLLYEFYVSTGKNVRGRRTPKGHYRINGIRQYWFYAPSEHEGARYAVGWLDGGEYLFHETPSNIHQRIIKSVAKDLGKKGSSYGCIHLSTSDAKWFYHNVPTGMPVIIK